MEANVEFQTITSFGVQQKSYIEFQQ